MFLVQADELSKHISNIIHKDTQQHELTVDLTIAQIHRFTKPGSMDFGGSEFKTAESDLIQPSKRNPDDKYGWWNLEEGTYKAHFNEQLKNSEMMLAIISLHNHARNSGIISNSLILSGENSLEILSMNFHVPHTGCKIKENARFASLHILAG